MVFARAGRYTSRPGHIDAMHVDVWFDGRPVATDAGTYRYWAEAPWANGLVEAEIHNTVTVEGLPMAERGPRFLWLRWPSARVASAARVMSGASDASGPIRIELMNESWTSEGVAHRRVCEMSERTVVITDELRATPPRNANATLHWLIDGPADTVQVTASRPVSVHTVTGDARSVSGWVSEGYATRRAVASTRVSATLAEGTLTFVSTFSAPA